MEKKLPAFLVLHQFLNLCLEKISCSKAKLTLLFIFISFSLWAQPPHTFNANGSIVVPAGITTMDVQAWGGGGAGGGASGAVLDGRAAAGGGGGAYARSNINVTAGATLNASVAATTTNVLVSGAAVNGAAGGSSTITGFETSILALGGGGGGANNAGGTPTGGAGGSAAGSVGNVTKSDGTAGGNGITGAIGLLTVSGAGGTGGGSGGVGGAGVASVALGNGPGNAGTAPGGGGSGAMQSLLGGAQTGGSGAAGRIIITYTCPTYSITGISATNVCNSVGTTSTVTLTSSAAGLPTGPYVVTYNRSSPSFTGLTAVMNVTTAGTGTFTAVGLSTIGASSITVTNLTSAACSSNISANNVAALTVYAATVGGSVAGTTAICSGAASGTLTLSGQTGSIIRWESSVSPFSTWTPITNTTNTYTSGALTQTTQFRAVIQNGNCAVVNSSAAVITVNPLPQGSLSANGPFCVTGNGMLTFTATAGTGPYTIVYTENGGTNRTATNVASGTAFPVFTTPVTTPTTTYSLVSVTGANSCSRSTGFTNGTATITVNSRIAAPVFGTITQPDCITSTGSVVLTGLPASSWTITQSGTASQTYNSSGTTYTISNLAVGNYTFTVQDATNCPSLATSNLNIIAPVTNIWNGTSWSKGSPPISTDAVRFSGNYSTTGNLSGCSLLVDTGVTVTVNSNHTLTISNAVTNNGGQLIFENNSSLLQTNNVTNSGNITYKRITPPVRRYDFTYWSSPIIRTPPFTLYDLSPGTLGDKYYSYDPVAGWIISFNGTQQMIPGHGYMVRAPQTNDLNTGTNYLGAFIGVPNNGPISVSLGTAEAFQLLGNPYPSAIYADQFIASNSANLYGTLYFWTHNSLPSNSTPGGQQYNYDNNDYAVYNLSGSVIVGGMTGQGATTPGNQNAPSGYIAAGQGFFVVSKTAGSAVFTNSMRVSGNNTQFYKTDQTNKTAIERHRLWLNLTNTQGAFKQLLIGYIEGATNSWDHNYDAITADANPYLDFYSINEGMNLVIQGRSLPFSESDIVPLGYRSAIAGEFSIALDHADGDLANHAVYLEDKATNTIHNLLTSNYIFTTTIGVFPERFVIRYANSAGNLGVDDFDNQNNSFYASVKDKNIRLNSTSDLMKEVSIFDVSGKLLYKNKKVENTELQISNFQSANQVLIVKVTLENGSTITRKVIF